jgi:hypothetical protein
MPGTNGRGKHKALSPSPSTATEKNNRKTENQLISHIVILCVCEVEFQRVLQAG